MNILLSYPQIVESYSPSFEDLFSPEGYIYFQRYLSGLMVSENKTIEAINRLFVLERRNQSSFNRFVTRQNFDVAALHRRRLDWLQGQAATRFKPLNEGVIALDDTLLSHYGRKMENIYNLYDHVHEHYTLAHNLVSLHYSDDTTDYPIAHDLWIPPDWEAIALKMKSLDIHINADRFLTRLTKPTKWRNYMRDRFRTYKDRQPILKSMYQTKLTLGLAMLRQFRADYPTIDLPVAMDSGYTSAEMCQALDKDLNIAYVGSLAEGQTLILSGSEEITLGDLKKRLVEQHLTKAPDGTQPNSKFFKTSVSYKGKKLVLYAYCANHQVKGYHKKQRLVISFKEKDLSDVPRYSISNRLNWFASKILRIRRHRWPIETFHQEGKEEGLDKYQLRDFTGIKTHIAFVSTVYSMLEYASHDQDLLSKFRQRLDIEPTGTLAFLRKLMKADGLMVLIEFIFLQSQKGQSIDNTISLLVPYGLK